MEVSKGFQLSLSTQPSVSVGSTSTDLNAAHSSLHEEETVRGDMLWDWSRKNGTRIHCIHQRKELNSAWIETVQISVILSLCLNNAI